MSRTLKHLDDTNTAIVLNALDNHAKHYRCLCHWIRREIAKPKRSRKFFTGPEAVGILLAEGHTVATVIWEIYGEEQKP